MRRKSLRPYRAPRAVQEMGRRYAEACAPGNTVGRAAAYARKTGGEIFSEIKRLSLLGLIPVVGGVTGGIIADRVTHTNNRKGTADKVKEGLYQYLANIFLCNVGAGTALFLSEKLEKPPI